MRKLKLFLVLLLLVSMTVAYAAKSNGVTLVSSKGDETILKITLTKNDIKRVQTPKGIAIELLFLDAGKIMKKGAPDLPTMAASLLIPDDAKMKAKIVDSKFKEYFDINIAPSKGNLSREFDPAAVPYKFGKEYKTNAFFPGKLLQKRTPHIVRDFRGQTIIFNPVQYNPVTKTLRVYHEITVKVSNSGMKGSNILVRNKPLTALSTEFRNVYSRHFLNFAPALEKYTPVDDSIGNYLVISYSSFMDEMADFVTWKESIGYNVDLVSYSTIGSSSALKTYVANYYNSNGLTFLLLVGD
ncbi:MAG: agmatine deiminase, partial [Candidatus Aminicenantes bacterium]|nr:agmatine deiminase [Candidatus Aminicenantes bacterium]